MGERTEYFAAKFDDGEGGSIVIAATSEEHLKIVCGLIQRNDLDLGKVAKVRLARAGGNNG